MDKAEYHLKLQELTKYVEEQDYTAALKIVESVEWRRVKSLRTLNMVADVYEANRMYRECKDILQLAFDRASIGKSILYRLVEVCLKLGEIEEAVDYYTEFAEVAPHDNSRYILKYKIYRARRSPLQDQIAILEEYKDREYTERWAYELARLYSKAGDQQKCVETCDDMILWFSEGQYVRKAMELKQKYQPLSPIQQAAYQKEVEREREESEQKERGSRPPKAEEAPASSAPQAAAAALAAAAGSAAKAAAEVRDAREVLQKMDEAGAAITKDVELPKEPKKPEGTAVDDFSVTSREFMGKTANLKEQLEKSIQDVFSGIRREAPQAPRAEVPEQSGEPGKERTATANLPIQDLEQELMENRVSPSPKPEQASPVPKEENPEDQQIEGQMSLADFDLEALVQETADSLSAEIASDAAPEPVKEEEPAESAEESPEKPEEPAEKAAEEPEESAEKAAEEPEAEAPEQETKILPDASEVLESSEQNAPTQETRQVKPLYNEELEIPDPEPTPEEKAQRTITLSKLGQNTIPISIDEILREETPEERRIRILNDAKPVRMNDEQRKIFTYFARVPGMDQQILEAMNGVYEHAGEHTSKHGNIAIMGAPGTGKSQLSQGLMVAMCKDLELDAAKIARISGASMNQKDPAKIVARMSGGFLIIEDASLMNEETVEQLNRAMEFRTDCMILIIEDEKADMRAMLKKYPEFARKFDKVISIPVFTNDELVTFARTYASENGYKMDEMGILALYTMIGNNQSERDPMTISKVKEIMDKAMAHAGKGSKKRGRRKKNRNTDELIVLQEKDFEV